MWLPGPTFGNDTWERYSPTNPPFGRDWVDSGEMPWKKLNEMWEGTPKGWIAPMRMANWPD
jgi:hypothetical protein